MAEEKEDLAEKAVEYRYFISFISKECSGIHPRNDIVTCDHKLLEIEDFRQLERFLAGKHLAREVIIQTFQLL
jgi:hypothetical protein